MTEIGELIAVPVGHTNPSEKCPFCPPKARKGYTTHPGSANNSAHLESIMEKPACLVEKQSGARPQTGKAEDDAVIEQEKPGPRNKDESKPYTFQAHHLISGNQAMKGQPIEDWIKASDKNEKDTGYSINNTNNGFWAPSMPKEYVGKWGPGKKVLTDDERQLCAEEVMADAKAQIHIGPHNISDPDDPKGYKHWSYDKYLKLKLKEIANRVVVWAEKCRCETSGAKKKKQATHHLHNNLDNLSVHMKRQISGPRKKWVVFLSKYAMEYHKPVCQHDERGKKARRR